MIKIIEYGTIKKQKCPHCGCLFSYEAIDIEKGDSADIRGMELYKKPYKFVRCPQCEYKIILGGIK